MLREIAQIVFAIHMSLAPQQHLSEQRIQYYAAEIQKAADKADVDPLLYVSIITHESQWNERAISPDHEDYGLMQTRARYYNGGTHPEWLLNPHYNIQIGTLIITGARDFCRRFLKREPTLQEWMSVYQGSKPSCKPTKLTKIVEDYFQCLVNRVDVNGDDGPLIDCREVYWPVHRVVGKDK